MDTPTLYPILFLFFLALFSHGIAYRAHLFRFPKSDLHPFYYPHFVGFLTLIAIATYLFPIPFLPWYFGAFALIIYFASVGKNYFLPLLKNSTTLPSTTIWRDALIGATIFLVSLPLLSFLQNGLEWLFFQYFHLEIPKQFFVDFISEIRGKPLLIVVTFTIVCILVPIYEEFLYRANLQNWLKNFFSPFWAIFVSSLLFSISHFFTVDTFQGKFLIITSIFVASMYLGFAYERQRSLISSITFHALVNTTTFLQALFFS